MNVQCLVLCFVADEWKTLVENSGPKFDVWYGWWIELFLRRNKHQQSLTPHLPNIGLLSGASAKFPWMSLTRFVNSESFTYIKILLWPLFKYRETFETQLSTVKEVEKFNWFWLNSLYLFFPFRLNLPTLRWSLLLFVWKRPHWFMSTKQYNMLLLWEH